MTTLRVSHLSDPRQIATAVNNTLRKTDPFDVSADQTTATVDRTINVVNGAYQIAGVQVVGARQTGWAADTGTAKLTANATYVPGTSLTYSATYAQSEQTAGATRIAAIEAALQNLSQEVKAIKDLALYHGLAGA